MIRSWATMVTRGPPLRAHLLLRAASATSPSSSSSSDPPSSSSPFPSPSSPSPSTSPSSSPSTSSQSPIRRDYGKLLLVVAAALIDKSSGRILLTQRPMGKSHEGLWEFPGGKCEAGEMPERALTRELKEELGIDVQVNSLRPLSFISNLYGYTELIMLVYATTSWHGTAHGAEGQAFGWFRQDELASLSWVPNDLPLLPIVSEAMRNASQKGHYFKPCRKPRRKRTGEGGEGGEGEAEEGDGTNV